jgi:hypothetical protein
MIAMWTVTMRRVLPHRTLAITRVRDYLVMAVLPGGWNPVDETDAVLVAIFATYWKRMAWMVEGVVAREHKNQLRERIKRRGYRTATAIAEAYPTRSVRAFARDLGGDPTATYFVALLFEEARANGTIARWARGLLVREIHAAHPDAWVRLWKDHPLLSPGRTAAQHRADIAIKIWAQLARQCLPGTAAAVGRIEVAFGSMDFEDDWLPAGPDDPMILALFAVWLTPHVRDQRRDSLAEA